MNYSDILKECLQNPFSIENYRKFVVNFLNGTQLRDITKMRSADIFAEYSFYVEGFALVGEYVDPNRKHVGIFVVKLKSGRDIEKARNKQRNFTARLISDNNLDAALVAFYLNEDTKWRLSFVRIDYEFVKGTVAKNLTPAKRYSYLVGKDEPCHTALESLLPIFEAESFRPTVDAIEQAFSVEKVTRQFFEKYKEKFLELTEYLENTPCFVEEAKTRKFTTEQFAKKLMGQIVFLYFLQKKGWLGVKAIKQIITASEYKNLFYYNARTRGFAPRLYSQVDENTYKLNQSALAELSEEEEKFIAFAIKGEPWGTGPRTFMRDLFNFAMKKKANFFDDYLEPLFYEGMNRQRDADNYYPRLHCRIPFLNGGLFEELGHYDWRNNAFQIPNEMFSNAHLKSDPREADGILDIFDRYNFTMNEDEPLEKEVAVDPEMLGKIFENLLDVKDRKSKGAFYTPREIVHYMCQESLINYLVNTVGTPYEDTKDFVLYGDIMKDEDCSREGTYGLRSETLMPESIYNNLKEIDEALADVRVADPAVGSGAFPMGMLSEIVKLREIITEYMARELCLRPEYRGTEKAGALKAAIWRLRNEQRNSYRLKKETMRNSIYAVDIEPSAVDIAKLRLWLTLVVEQEIDPNDPDNDSPLALPNLDCNVMCGNSLIDEFEDIDLSFDSILFGDGGQGTLWDSGIDTDLERLFSVQRDYFYADSRDKKIKCAELIAKIKARLIDHAFTSAGAEKRARFDAANNDASTPFFLWKLNFAKVFKDKGGFDIVIGNPPYIQLQKSISETDKTKLGDLYSGLGFDTFAKTGDIYCLFYEKGHELLKPNGILAYITSNKWMKAGYGEKLRGFLARNTNPRLLLDFAGQKIFESATVDVNILIYEKAENQGKTLSCIASENCLKNLSVYVMHNGFPISFSTSKSWAILNPIEQSILKKIHENGVPLSEWDIRINFGIKTGYNDAFIIPTEKRDELIHADPKSAEIIRPILRGRDIKRYKYDFADLWLISTFPSLHYNIDDYPAVRDYLLSFGIQKLEQTGEIHIVNGEKVSSRKKTMNKWFETQDSIAYWDDFSMQKIIWKRIGSILRFCIDDNGMVCLDSTCFATGESIPFLTAVLNSYMGNYLFSDSPKTGTGDLIISVQAFEPIRIPRLDSKQQEPFVTLLKQILNAISQNQDYTHYEEKLNDLVFDLYHLSEEEREWVKERVLSTYRSE